VSIIKTRSFLEKSGCGLITSIVCGAIMFVGILGITRGCGPDKQMANGNIVVFSVANIDYSAQSIQKIVSRQAEVYGGTIEMFPPNAKAQMYKQVVSELVNDARLIKLGEKMDVKVSDEEMNKKQEEIMTTSLQSMYAQFVAAQKASKTPKDAKPAKVMSFDEFRKLEMVQAQVSKSKSMYREFTATPDGASYIRAGFVREALLKKMTNAKTDKPSSEQMQKASSELQAKLKASEKDYPVTWNDHSYRLLYQWGLAGQDATALMKLAEDASEILSSPESANTGSSDIAALAYYGICEDLAMVAKPADKEKVTGWQIDAIDAVLRTNEDFSLRLKLADLLIQTEDGPRAADTLKTAIEYNREFNPKGQIEIKQAEDKLKKLVNSKMVDEKQAALVQKAVDDWYSEKAQDEKDKAEEAKLKAENEKEMAAERAKYEKEQKAEEAKQKSENSQSKKTDTQKPTEKKPDEKK
jgi:hypothetical protein